MRCYIRCVTPGIHSFAFPTLHYLQVPYPVTTRPTRLGKDCFSTPNNTDMVAELSRGERTGGGVGSKALKV